MWARPNVEVRRAEEKLEQIARKVARPENMLVTPEGDSVELSELAVEMLIALESYRANLKAIQEVDEMESHAIDVLG